MMSKQTNQYSIKNENVIRSDERLTQPNRLDGEPYTKEELERFFETALKEERDK